MAPRASNRARAPSARHRRRLVLGWLGLAASACQEQDAPEPGASGPDAGPRPAPACELPPSFAPCDGARPYYHDPADDRCKLAGDLGCRNNDNFFASFADCMRTCPPALPEDCRETLAFVEEPARCLSGARCDDVRLRSERDVRWTLLAVSYRMDENGNDVFVEPAEIEHEVRCLDRYLATLGVVPQLSPNREWLSFESSFALVGSVLHLAAVASYELECSESECARCETLPEEACRADPFCWAREGTRLDPGRGCTDSGFGGCLPGNLGCSDALTSATAPDGACWRFSSSCVPAGFDRPAPDCDDQAIDAAPACEAP